MPCVVQSLESVFPRVCEWEICSKNLVGIKVVVYSFAEALLGKDGEEVECAVAELLC